MSVVQLKKLWDELTCLMPIPQCTSRETKLVIEITIFNYQMQFLIRLNDSFDHIQNQIMLMDPLPSVNKAYSMVLRVEKQRWLQMSFIDNTGNSAIFVGSQNFKKDGASRGNFKKKDPMKKSDRHCDYCNTNGYVRYICLKLQCYLDWFKQLQEQKEKVPSKLTANVIDTPLDVVCDQWIGIDAKLTSSIAEVIQQEITKYMKGKSTMDGNYINLAHQGEYASTILNYALDTLDLLELETQIIDTKASNHMCIDLITIIEPF